MARVVLALVDVFANSLFRIILVALVTRTSERTRRVLALTVHTRVVVGAFIDVSTGLAVWTSFESNLADALVITNDIGTDAVRTLVGANTTFVYIDALLVSLKRVCLETIIAGTSPSSLQVDALSVGTLGLPFNTLINVHAFLTVRARHVASGAFTIPPTISINTGTIITDDFTTGTLVDVAALEVEVFRFVSFVTKTDGVAIVVGDTRALLAESFRLADVCNWVRSTISSSLRTISFFNVITKHLIIGRPWCRTTVNVGTFRALETLSR